MKLPQLGAFAKAQLWGMAVGFALALLATSRMELGLGVFFVGWIACWVGWEFTLGPGVAANAKNDAPGLAIGILTGFMVPWGGFLLAYLLANLRP